MQDLDGVICVFLGFKLDEAITLVLIRHLVPWDVYVDNGPCLEEQLPNDLFVDPRLQIADINRGLLIALKERTT